MRGLLYLRFLASLAHDAGRVARVVTDPVIINGVISTDEVVMHGDMGTSHCALSLLLLTHHGLGHVERPSVLVFSQTGARDVRMLTLKLALKFVLLVAVDE